MVCAEDERAERLSACRAAQTLGDDGGTNGAGDRKQRIIFDIIDDFGLKPRLNNDRGTAILVAASIYDACHYFRLFRNTTFGQYCGIITSYEPNHNAISREPAGTVPPARCQTSGVGNQWHVMENRL